MLYIIYNINKEILTFLLILNINTTAMKFRLTCSQIYIIIFIIFNDNIKNIEFVPFERALILYIIFIAYVNYSFTIVYFIIYYIIYRIFLFDNA